MRLWRLSRFPALDGAGGLFASARWHTIGRPVIYAAPSPEGALLEVRVHLDVAAEEIPDGYRLLGIDVPDDASIEDVAGLPSGWERDETATRSLGDVWLDARRTLLLRVPGAILPYTVNYLINPRHPGAERLQVAIDDAYPLEPRLFPPTHP